MPSIIAHRGASAVEPENTLAAFRRAVSMGADGIELDVHGTADGVLVVHHDPEIARHPIREHTLGELRQAPLANGEPLPTLPEALHAIGPALEVFIEVKALDAAHDRVLFEAIDAAPAPNRCRVHAFDHRLVRRLVDARPGLSAGVLSASYPLDPVAQVRAAGADTLWQHRDLIDAPLVALARDAGVRVIAWTVDRPDHARQFVHWGVEGLCTNVPDRLREALR